MVKYHEGRLIQIISGHDDVSLEKDFPTLHVISVFLFQLVNARTTGSAMKDTRAQDDVSVKQDGLGGCAKPS